MDKMKEKAPYFELKNSLTPDNSPIGYPDMAGKLPSSYPKLYPAKRVIMYAEGKRSHSINPERPSKHTWAPQSQLKSMKLVK